MRIHHPRAKALGFTKGITSLFLNIAPEKLPYMTPIYRNRLFYLLNVNLFLQFVRLDKQDTINATQFQNTRAFQPSKTIAIKNWNLSYSEWLFEDVIKQQWYSPTKVGVLLPRVEVQENLVDYALVENAVKSNEITPNQLPLLFNATPEGKALPWRKTSTGETEILVDSPGWVFVSQMWYPHFRVNGKPLQEAGGGLSAFYADAPGVYTIYWKKPWYDYLFLTISITALIILGYLYFNQNILNKLNSE